MNNKDWRGVIDALDPHMDQVVVTQADATRGADPIKLCTYLQSRIPCKTQVDPGGGFRNAKSAANKNGVLLVVTGSLYLAGIIRRQFTQE